MMRECVPQFVAEVVPIRMAVQGEALQTTEWESDVDFQQGVDEASGKLHHFRLEDKL